VYSQTLMTGETWCESDIHRTAGDIALLAPEPEVNKAEIHFSRALAAAREQQAKSWELRAATSLARLWYDRGEHNKAGVAAIAMLSIAIKPSARETLARRGTSLHAG